MCFGFVLYYPRQDRDTFSYGFPGYNASICSSPSSEEFYPSQNYSLCAERLYENVPKFFNAEDIAPFAFDLFTACNGVGPLYSLLLGYVPGLCPECQLTSSCTEEEIAAHAQGFCLDECDIYLGMSLYPDLSRTDPYNSSVLGCSDAIGTTNGWLDFRASELAEPAMCSLEGNLSQQIELKLNSGGIDPGRKVLVSVVASLATLFLSIV